MPSTDSVPKNTNWYLKEYQLADLCSTWRHINSHQGSSLTRATCHCSKLIHGFVKVVTSTFSPFATQNQAEVWPRFQRHWSFCIEIKLLNESKYSMPWVRCAFGNVCIFVLMHLWYSIVEQRSFAVLAVCVTSKRLQLMASSIAHKLTQYRQYNLLLENNTFLGLQRKIYLFYDCSRLEHCVRGSSSGCKRWITFDSKLEKRNFQPIYTT